MNKSLEAGAPLTVEKLDGPAVFIFGASELSPERLDRVGKLLVLSASMNLATAMLWLGHSMNAFLL